MQKPKKMDRTTKVLLLILVFPFTFLLCAPKFIIEIAEEWNDWGKGIINWWKEL